MPLTPGKQFEKDISDSAAQQKIFFYRIKDAPSFKSNNPTSKNNYDAFVYKKPNLFPMELKSTKGKSFSFSPKIIKPHQIHTLNKAVEYDGLIAGFLFNFRESDNATYFVHIKDFINVMTLAQKGEQGEYKHKLNKSSISLATCEEVGIPLKNVKKKVNYRYYIKMLLDELISKYGESESDRTNNEIHTPSVEEGETT